MELELQETLNRRGYGTFTYSLLDILSIIRIKHSEVISFTLMTSLQLTHNNIQNKWFDFMLTIGNNNKKCPNKQSKKKYKLPVENIDEKEKSI